MTPIAARVLMAALFLLPSAGCATAQQLNAAQPGTNILQNPGFEQGDGEVPAGWTLEDRVRQKGRSSVVTDRKSGGARALRLQPNRNNTADVLAFNMGQGFPIAPMRGRTLTASAWLAGQGGATAALDVSVVDRTGQILANTRLTNDRSQGSRVTQTLEVPDDSRAFLLIVTCQVFGNSGSAYFDDISVAIEDGGRGRAAAPAASGPLAARIDVDAGATVRRIPETLYGNNLEWAYGGNLIWDFRNSAMNMELVRLTRDLGVTLLRFPGGSFADFYHWRDGVGPMASRKETEHMPLSDRSRHTFGTDEALDFAQRAGAQLLITVNIHTGTPEEAADWVRYVNGKSRRVTYWEIGNESYIKNDHPANAAMPPGEYAERYIRFARAMKAADPGIKLLAIGGENYGRYNSVNYPGWNREVLTRAGSLMDFLAVHNAYLPAVLEDTSADVRTVYQAMLAGPVLIARNLETLSRQIEEFAPGRQIEIAVTEWAPMFHLDPRNKWVDHGKTLGSALFTASTLKAMIESPATTIATAFKLNAVGFNGWIGPRHADHVSRAVADDQYLPTAPYLATQLFTRHFGETLVTSSVVSPTYDSRAIGMVSSVDDVPYVEAIASRSEDGRTLYVMVINKHFDDAAAATVRLQRFTPGSQGTAWTLTGTGIDANTGTKLPNGVPWGKQVEDRDNPRFSKGGPKEVTLTSAPLKGPGTEIQYQVPKHSIVVLEIPGTASR